MDLSISRPTGNDLRVFLMRDWLFSSKKIAVSQVPASADWISFGFGGFGQNKTFEDVT